MLCWELTQREFSLKLKFSQEDTFNAYAEAWDPPLCVHAHGVCVCARTWCVFLCVHVYGVCVHVHGVCVCVCTHMVCVCVHMDSHWGAGKLLECFHCKLQDVCMSAMHAIDIVCCIHCRSMYIVVNCSESIGQCASVVNGGKDSAADSSCPPRMCRLYIPTPYPGKVCRKDNFNRN